MQDDVNDQPLPGADATTEGAAPAPVTNLDS